MERRAPEYIHSLSQPYDASRFNFTKIKNSEILFTMSMMDDTESNNSNLDDTNGVSLMFRQICTFIIQVI